MRLDLRILFLFVFMLARVAAQLPADPLDPRRREDVKLPNGKSQKDAILKADHQKNLEDAERLEAIAAELKRALEKNTEFVLSLDELKKLDELDKITKRLRNRIRRY